MKMMEKIAGKISLCAYIVVLYQVWHLCQYRGLRSHLFRIGIGVGSFGITSILWLVAKSYGKRRNGEKTVESRRKNIVFRVEIVVFLMVTLYFGGRAIYTMIPYHGALSWKVDEWTRKKEITLEHTNFFKDGVEGVFEDLDRKLNLPDELYLVNQYQMSFDQEGEIEKIYTFFYGKNKKGENKTYLVDYDSSQSEKMSVWIDGAANLEYQEEMRLQPMFTILKKADYEEKVEQWVQDGETGPFAILYFGKRSFDTETGMIYLPGDVDGDGKESELPYHHSLIGNGQIAGYEVSLHISDSSELFPIRYMMEPEYISLEKIEQERVEEQTEEAKNTESWTVDQGDGSMYFFVNETVGWRLVITDAAAGSRFYELERSEDGGTTWERINHDPFSGSIGVAEGLLFFDEQFGFVGLTGASQSYSQMYITRDGGETFDLLQLPMDTVTTLPDLAATCGYTIADYDYLNMPEKTAGWSILVTTEASEQEGIRFESMDDGVTWEYRP